MNLKQLAKDLEKQGYICELSEDGSPADAGLPLFTL
jgi:hypothetical protein